MCVPFYWDAVGKKDILYHLVYHFDLLSLACPGRFKDTVVVWFLILSAMINIFSLHVVFHYPHYQGIYYARCILVAFPNKQSCMLSWDSDLKCNCSYPTARGSKSKSARAVCYKLLNLPRHMQIVKADA